MGALRRKNILVVHPDPRQARLICLRLQRKGFHVEVAINREDVRNHIFYKAPDLLVMSERLGHREGAEVYDWLVALGFNIDIPVVFLSPSRQGPPQGLSPTNRLRKSYCSPSDSRRLATDIADYMRF